MRKKPKYTQIRKFWDPDNQMTGHNDPIKEFKIYIKYWLENCAYCHCEENRCNCNYPFTLQDFEKYIFEKYINDLQE